MTDLLLFRAALRDLLRFKRLAAAVPLAVLPAALALLWRAAAAAKGGAAEPEVVYNTLCGGLIFGFTLVILAVLFGTGVISQELEGRTIGYLLTRPVPRARILLAKFLGAFAGITLTVWLSTILLALAARVSWEPVWRDLAVLPAGALAYGGLFLLVAAALDRPLIYGLFFAFGWESWIPLMPGNFQRVSVMTYLRVLAPHPKPPDEEGDITDVLAALNPTTITPGHARWVLLGVILVALGLALWVFSRREYAPREDAE